MDLTTAGHEEGMGAAEPGLFREELKAERIQAGAAAEVAAEPGLFREELKAERIQAALDERLPGWQLTAEGAGITRTFPVTAARNRPLVAFAGYVAELARHHGVAADLEIQGGGVTVTLSNRTGGLTEAELGLAETLAQ